MAKNEHLFGMTKREIAGIGDGNGMFAEDVMFGAVEKDKIFAGVQFDEVRRGMEGDEVLPNGKKIRAEFDVVLLNGTSVALIEAKYRVRRDDLERLIYVQLPKFRRVFPQYRDFKIYLGLGGMSFNDGVMEEALLRGVGTLKFDGGTLVEVNDKNATAW
jgi:hypothetical protein